MKHYGSDTFDQIADTFRMMSERSMARKLEGVVKEILGTAQSVGCYVEGSNPHVWIDRINNGEINLSKLE